MASTKVVPNDVTLLINLNGVNTYWLWKEKLLRTTSSIPYVSLLMTYLVTLVIYQYPLPVKATIIRENTIPAVEAVIEDVAAGIAGVDAVAAQAPSAALVTKLTEDHLFRRVKEMAKLRAHGTHCWDLLFNSLSPSSQAIVENHPDYEAANDANPKWYNVLIDIIRTTHLASNAPGNKHTAQDKLKIKKAFELWMQGDLSLDEMYKQFKLWELQLQDIGVAPFTPTERENIFISKLHSRYHAFVRERENMEMAANIHGTPVAVTPLHLLVELIRTYKTAPTTQSTSGKSAAVFVAPAAKHDSHEQVSIATACQRIARELGIPASKLQDELTRRMDRVRSANKGTIANAPRHTCSVTNPDGTRCNGLHKYFEHEKHTGHPPDAATQARMDDWAANGPRRNNNRRRSSPPQAAAAVLTKVPKPKAASVVTFAAEETSDDSDDEYYVNTLGAMALTIRVADPDADDPAHGLEEGSDSSSDDSTRVIFIQQDPIADPASDSDSTSSAASWTRPPPSTPPPHPELAWTAPTPIQVPHWFTVPILLPLVAGVAIVGALLTSAKLRLDALLTRTTQWFQFFQRPHAYEHQDDEITNGRSARLYMVADEEEDADWAARVVAPRAAYVPSPTDQLPWPHHVSRPQPHVRPYSGIATSQEDSCDDNGNRVRACNWQYVEHPAELRNVAAARARWSSERILTNLGTISNPHIGDPRHHTVAAPAAVYLAAAEMADLRDRQRHVRLGEKQVVDAYYARMERSWSVHLLTASINDLDTNPDDATRCQQYLVHEANCNRLDPQDQAVLFEAYTKAQRDARAYYEPIFQAIAHPTPPLAAPEAHIFALSAVPTSPPPLTAFQALFTFAACVYQWTLHFLDGTAPTDTILTTSVKPTRANIFGPGFMLYDPQAGLSISKSADGLFNVHTLARARVISGIGPGAETATQAGERRGFPGILFHILPTSSTNMILAECDALRAGWHRSVDGPAYILTPPTGTPHRFEIQPGWTAHPALPLDAELVLATTAPTNRPEHARTNAASFSTAQIKAAKDARKLQRNLGLPCSEVLIRSLPFIQNAGVSPHDVRRADAIAGKPLEKVRGGTTRHPPTVTPIEAGPLRPPTALTAELDIYFICGMAFLTMVLLPTNYVMACHLKLKTVTEVANGIRAFTAKAAAYNCAITLMRCDGEKSFAAYAPELELDHIVVDCSPGDHCPHIERVHRTINEYVRGQLNGGCLARMGKALLIMCVLFKVSRMNDVQTKACPSGFSPRTLLTGDLPTAFNFRWGYGDYVESTKPSTSGAKSDSVTEACIAGIPLNNTTSAVQLFRLSTETMITRSAFTVRPWSDWVTDTVNAIGDRDNLNSGDEPGLPWGLDFDDDDVQVPQQPPQAAAGAGVGDIALYNQPGAGVPGAIQPGAGVPGAVQPGAGVHDANQPEAGVQGNNQPGAGVHGINQPGAGVHGVNPPPAQIPRAQLPKARRGRAGGTDSLSSLPAPPSNAVNIGIDAADRAALRREVDARSHWHDKEYCFKVSVKAALRERGESARTAILDELKQMVTKKVWHGVHTKNLSESQRSRILRMVTFLKDKYTPQNVFDKFKCRTCVDGSRQDHELYENISSPTATTTSVLGIAAIAAAEGRHVMTVDIGGAYLHADITCTGIAVHVRLDRVMTQFLLELDPTYAEFVCTDGTCVVELDKALYGTIEAAKLWYDNISGKLIEDGFVPNPYDPCVFNRTTKAGVQTTIVLYVDDMLVTSVDLRELDSVAASLRKKYGEIAEHRGITLDFLGMTFDFTTKGEVRVTMKRLVDEIIAGCGITRERATPATENLFDVRDLPGLARKDHDYFRTFTAKLLYVCKRVKPEMLTAVSFLTTRASSPDSDDLAKLHRALGYLIATRERGIVLRIGEAMSVQAFVDAAYGVHTSSGKSHSGCAVVLGDAGPIHVKSTKQKLVTKSSTEAELVALSDYASQALWVRNFIIAQGYDVGPVVLHQDNMSCMALIKRGGPASERSRHISIRQFWVKEKVDDKEAVVKHLPTGSMFVNVMTKPVQGQQFVRERNALTNWY